MKISQKNIENWWFWKTQFFESAILIFFALSPWKLVTDYVLGWMGLNFYCYDGLQPKMSAGMINEHECMYVSISSFIFNRIYTFPLSNQQVYSVA